MLCQSTSCLCLSVTFVVAACWQDELQVDLSDALLQNLVREMVDELAHVPLDTGAELFSCHEGGLSGAYS